MTSTSLGKKPSQFAAVELQPEKTPHQLVQVLLETCHTLGMMVDELLVMEVMSLGAGRKFLRFRSDLDMSILGPELLKLGLGVVNALGEVRMPGKNHPQRLLLSRLCSTRPSLESPPLPYRGTRDQYWRRQFH